MTENTVQAHDIFLSTNKFEGGLGHNYVHFEETIGTSSFTDLMVFSITFLLRERDKPSSTAFIAACIACQVCW